ncbi:uncharacterized protein [Zea mays]|uniref:uncharacterized protein n=1 Tax=Zea mays TaxID=4577 RepID=UPI000C6C58B1|nr:uncharacterized protein LOC111589337 [Zea mays]|eukprot:XP_023155945.1 uncharacterized protein LOC111589337 [Zea mays]
MADDDDVNPITGNDDLHAAGLVPDDEDDIQADAAALLGIDLTSAPVDLSSNPTNAGGGPATATDTPVGSTSTDGGTGTSSVGKRKSTVWVDFDEVFEKVNGPGRIILPVLITPGLPKCLDRPPLETF